MGACPAEESTRATAYSSAKARHPDRAWPDPRRFDSLNLVVRKEPVAVSGALGFGLKAIGKAMHAQGLIGTSRADGPDGWARAMVGA